MKTSSIEPARAGVRSGSVTRRNRCQELAPRPDAASSSVVSKRSRPAETNRKNVDIHRVGVNEHDRPYSGESPRSFRHAERALHCSREHSALAVEKEECDYADERRECGRQSGDYSQHSTAGKLEAAQKKRQRNADEE